MNTTQSNEPVSYPDGFNPNVPVTALSVWVGNPRKTIDQAKLGELAKSIQSIGLQQPIVVRPCDAGLEVIAGQRRFMAAQIAGVETVPCMVQRLDDDQALEVSIAENAARADVSPIEEAEAIDAYMRRGRTLDQAADRFGRSAKWVERRVRLLALIPAWRERVAAETCPILHAELLAGLTEDVQAKLFRRWDGCTLPAHYEFERSVHAALHRLDGAPFDIADDTYPSGSCGPCASRTDKQRDLFSDGSSEEGAACLNPTCWAAKVETRWERAQKIAKKRKLTVLSAREAGLASSGACLPGSAWIEAERAIKQYPGLAAKGIARTDEGLVVELVSHDDYQRARDAQLEALKKERDARKAAADARAKTDESEESDESIATAPTVPPSAVDDEDDDEDAEFDRDRAQEQLDAARYEIEAEHLAVYISATDGTAHVRRRALLRFCGLGIKGGGAQRAIAKAMGFDDWKRDIETEDVHTLLDALLIDNVLAQAAPGEIEKLCGVAPAKPATDDGVAQMVARFSDEIAAARTEKDLGDAWVAIESEDHRASLPALAKLWTAKAERMGVSAGTLKVLVRKGRAPSAELTKEAA